MYNDDNLVGLFPKQRGDQENKLFFSTGAALIKRLHSWHFVAE